MVNESLRRVTLIERSQLKGVVVPLATPLHPDGVTVNTTALQQLVDRLIRQGAHGIFVGGTTGEIWALDEAQWERLIVAGVEACAGRVPFYAGVSHPSTAGAVARVRRAAQLAARFRPDVVVALAPYYTPPSQIDIIRHFTALAQASDLPVLIYQFPGIVKTSITLPTYLALAAVPGVVGVKDSQADVTEFRHMIEQLRGNGRDFRLFLGTDALTDVAVLLGAQGTVPSIGNIAMPHLAETFAAAQAGDWSRAAAAQLKINKLKAVYKVAATESWGDGFIIGLKAALEILGVPVGPPAAPLHACDAAQREAIAALLREAELL